MTFRLLVALAVLCLPGMAAAQVDPWLTADVERPSAEDAAAQRRVREAQLKDPQRPVWHFTAPEGSSWCPFDPNGAIFKDGVYHLWYLYPGASGVSWAHVSSIDLFHWRWHPQELRPDGSSPEKSIDSGNAFVAGDGRVVISYHGGETAGNCVAYSDDLEHWTKSEHNPITDPGWDPHMWFENGTYYMISGGNPTSGEDKSVLLFTGDEYDRQLTRQGKFFAHDMPDVADFEDVSCPDFFRLGDKWVLVCISHQRGARYYIGTWDGKKFTPEAHHRMNWPGGTCFAPETLLDGKGRRIFWAWNIDRKVGSAFGTMTMPRVLTLAEDGLSLRIEPVEEVEALRYCPQSMKPFTVGAGESVRLERIEGNSMELNLTVDPRKAKRFGIRVFCSRDGRERTPVLFDREKNSIRIDLAQSSLEKPNYYEFCVHRQPNPTVEAQEAPFELEKGEKLKLRVFLDKSMLEVFANGRQCVTQAVYPTLEDAVGIEVFAEDSEVSVEECRSWQLFPALQW